MPGKFIKGGLINKQVPDSNNATNNQNESDPLVRNALRLPLAAAAGVGDLVSTVNSGIRGGLKKLTGVKEIDTIGQAQRQPFTSEDLHKNEYFKPQGKHEELLDMMASDLPLMLATGGISGARLGASLGGNLAIKGAQEQGVGPLGQFLSGMGGSTAVNLVNKGALPKYLRNKANELFKSQEQTARKIGKQIKEVKSPQLHKKIHEIAAEVNDSLQSSWKKRTLQNINSIVQDVNGEKINVNKIWDRKKSLGKLAYNSATNEQEAKFYRRASDAIDDFLSGFTGKKNAKFSEAYKTSNDLYTGIKAKSAITKMLEVHPDLIKSFPTKLLGLLTYPARAAGARVTGGIDLIWKSKTMRKYIADLSKEALYGDKAEFGNTLKKINKEIENSPQQPGKFIKGGVKS